MERRQAGLVADDGRDSANRSHLNPSPAWGHNLADVGPTNLDKPSIARQTLAKWHAR